jgi:FMN phosphatase YigB (HAD superfamily)
MGFFYPSVADIVHVPHAVIFDVDGTLYNLVKLRFFMVLKMIQAVLYSPKKVADLKIVCDFRKMRKRNSRLETWNLEAEQFYWTAQTSCASPQRVHQVVQEWIYDNPLPFLAKCRYGGVQELFSLLRDKGIRLGVFSDYPAQAKLKALGLCADVVVEATEKEVNRLKPHPAGLLLAAARLGTPIRSCLFIGDQDDRDGECARRAGMPYIILSPRNQNRQFKLLSTYVKKWNV